MMKTAVADTSIIAYRIHSAAGMLAAQQRQIVDFLAENQPADFTRAEIADALGMKHSTVCARVFELLEFDSPQLLEELPRRTCRQTGASAHAVQFFVPGQLSLFKA